LTTPKWRRVLLVVLLAAVVAVVIVLHRSQSPPIVVATHSTAPKPAGNRPALSSPAPIRPLPTLHTDTVELCGYGTTPIDKEDPGAVFQKIGILTRTTAARWLAALQNSGDLRSRAAGLWLDGKVTGGELLRPVAPQTRAAAIQLAAGAVDPAVYALVLSMCDKRAGADPDPACQQLSLQRWAAIDPDNAVPWLLLAGKARLSHDDAAEAEAFSHAAKAHRFDDYSDSLFAFSDPELPPDVTPLERSYFAIEVIGVEAAAGSPVYGVASQHCSSAAMQDSNVRQQCESLAQLLVRKGTTLLDLGVGRAIGARAGWSSDRINELLQEQHALMQAITQATSSDNDKLWTCDTVNRVNAYMVQRVRLGEVGAAREVLERSGETAEAMAQKYDQYMDVLRREARSQEPQYSAPPAP
jgi:hypothetical protein